MKDIKFYNRTIYACNLAMMMQAFIINITAILFVGLKAEYNLSFSQLGALVLVNFITQIVVDITIGKPAEKYGYRFFITITPILVVLGVLIFILSPFIFKSAYTGFIIGTIVFALAGGLLEVLVSPIVYNLPVPHKDKAMSLLHSFYGQGQILVVVITTLLIKILGYKYWQIIMGIWIILPVIVFFMFLKAPLVNAEIEMSTEKQTVKKEKIMSPFFIICLFAIILGGAIESIMGQWSSTFMEKGLGVSKLSGDLLAVATYATTFTLTRYLYGKYGEKVNITTLMLIGSVISTVCYFIIALSNNKVIVILACCVSGVGLSLLWPGTISVASGRFKHAGAWIFSLLACGGDIGCALGPYFTGLVSDGIKPNNKLFIKFGEGLSLEQFSLKVGLLVGAFIAVIGIFVQLTLYLSNKNFKKQLNREMLLIK